mmetsp:Transcript_8201/g.15134  ORF Transcript_8201/g.15134 Transcript_8201/m.15134 type:complete len:128 (-) Transcript_8201:1626-2009(-)
MRNLGKTCSSLTWPFSDGCRIRWSDCDNIYSTLHQFYETRGDEEMEFGPRSFLENGSFTHCQLRGKGKKKAGDGEMTVYNPLNDFSLKLLRVYCSLIFRSFTLSVSIEKIELQTKMSLPHPQSEEYI